MKNTTVVYWSPVWESQSSWNLLYVDPELVAKDLSYARNSDAKESNYLKCPANISYFKNKFVIKSVLPCNISIVNNEAIVLDERSIGAKVAHKPTLNNMQLIQLYMSWIFFTEDESLEMSITPPFFHQTKHSQYGSCIPGTFDIGKWFRHINAEYQLWSNMDKFMMNEDEAMMYVGFNTSNNIRLQRFNMTPVLNGIRNHTADSTDWYRGASIVERYKQFKESRVKPLILKEIKANLY